MPNKQKQNIIVACTAFVIIVITITSPYTKMFGRFYDRSKEFNCCKGGQLYRHQFYHTKFCWVNVAEGYSDSAIGKPSSFGCNIECPLDPK